MSIGKVSNAEQLGEEFKGLTIKEVLELIEKSFWKAYGRYENASGKLFIELEHHGDPENPEIGQVKWRKGERGNPELIEDLILDRDKAIRKYKHIINKGYYNTFKATTAEDFARENAKRESLQSALLREGLLGVYYKGKSFFRINEYEKGLYSVERGYDDMLSSGKHELTESEARCELDFALAEGFAREGEDADLCLNPLEAFGVTIEGNMAIDAANAKPKEGQFDLSGFAAMFNREDE